ncbi:MAG: hypothetical protein EOM50_19390 [Erysipelotrichia bacterium]|nr:hypothetical protein [Erysipelotrichia bacterium]
MIRDFYIECDTTGYYIWSNNFRKLNAHGFFEHCDDVSMVCGVYFVKHGEIYSLYDYSLGFFEIIVLSLTHRSLREIGRFTEVLKDNRNESQMITGHSFIGSFYDAFLWVDERLRIRDGKKADQGIMWDRVHKKCILSDRYRDDNYYHVLEQIQNNPKRYSYIELTQKQKDTPIPKRKEWSEEEIEEIWQIIGSFYGGK